MNNSLNDIRNRISQKKTELNLSYQDMSDKTGLSKSTLQRYITGDIRNLGLDKLEILAKALDVTPSYLMGWEDENEEPILENIPGIILPVKMKKIPILGTIACGEPIFAEENYEGYFMLDTNLPVADFVLRAKGDSMIDADINEGDLMESILEGFAQYYSKNLAQETKKGLYTNARSAKFNGGIVPFGFKLDDDNFYIINEYEAVAVRLMYELYLSGGNMSKIARSINDKGYTTRYNKPFTSDSIRRILTNPKNAGVYQYGLLETSYASTGKRTMKTTRSDEDIVTIEGAIPAIVDKDIFERVNEMIKRRANYRRPKQKVDYALKGKIFCSCGKPMVGNTFGPANKKYSYYKCKECGISVRKEPLENYILNVGRKYILSKSDRLIELIEEEVGKLMDTQDTDRQALKRRIDQIDREESNCINFITQMGANEKIKEKLEELSKEKKEIEASLNIELDPINLTKEVRMWIRKIKNEDENTVLNKKELIQLLVDRVVVDKESLKIYFNFCPPNRTTPLYILVEQIASELVLEVSIEDVNNYQ